MLFLNFKNRKNLTKYFFFKKRFSAFFLQNVRSFLQQTTKKNVVLQLYSKTTFTLTYSLLNFVVNHSR